MRFSGLSSTIKIFACGATNDFLFRSSASFHSTFEIFPSDTFLIGSCTKKLLPLPYTLSTQILPSICSTSCFAIASPNPVPLIFLFFFDPDPCVFYLENKLRFFFIFNDFCSACFSAINITSSSSCLSSYFPSSISIFPDSILEISKILLINEIR